MPGYTWTLRLQVLLINFAIISLFMAVGFALDRLFDTKPAFILVSFFISFPVTQWVSIKLIKRALAEQKDKTNSEL